MTPKKMTVLRTAFSGDRYVSGNIEITAEGTEVDAAKAGGLVAEARRAGVRLFEVPDEPTTEKGAS